MFIVLALLTSLSAVSILIAGSLALIRNPQLRLNQSFFWLTVALALWVPSNFFGSNTTNLTLTPILVKLDFSFAVFIAWTMLYFNTFLTDKKNSSFVRKSKPFFMISLIANFVLGAATLADLVTKVDLSSNELVLHDAILYPVYLFFFAFYIIFAFKNLLLPYFRYAKADRQKLNLIFIGLIIAVIANVLSNLVFPEVFSSRTTIQALNSIGYIGIVILVICFYVSITSRKLFDIRLIIARSLGYVLSLAFLVTSYALATYLITNILTSESGGTAFFKTSLSTLLIIFAAVSYNPLKTRFNRFTNRLFYRDAYDTQALLNSFNNVLVSTIDIKVLLQRCIDVIDQNLKAEFILFNLYKTHSVDRHVISNISSFVSDKDDSEISSLVSGYDKKVIVTDELDETNEELRAYLGHKKVSVLVRLVDNPKSKSEDLGYLLLGIKKSGNPYNKQDKQALEIISNELVIATQNALRFEEIEKFNITLQEKIDDATKRLKQTNDKLRALDETKDEFISMASHQLRTPLTSVKGYLSMVLEGDTGKVSKAQEKLLDQAFVSSQRMVYLIADLLNVSRLRTGKFVIEAAPMNLATAIEGEIGQLTETAKGRGLTLTYDKPDKFPELILDETKIRQVLMNFIDNAIYYTPSGGHIDVNLKDLGTSIEFTVVDDGLGVPKADQHHLFNKFYRAGNARKARPDGTGLGLFMAKKVVVAQGGSIIFKSTEGKGSTFGFNFAKAKLMPPPRGTTHKARTSTSVAGPVSDKDTKA